MASGAAAAAAASSCSASHLSRVLDEATLRKIGQSKLLVIGAGGIGCELLKNMVLSGFVDLEVVDLDTIDVSNLNRQFLFRPQHVRESKAVVASAAVREFNPAASIVAYHDNVTSAKFDIKFFRRFTLVISALDNVAARKHVNRLCLAAEIPLIEAGTAGYLGQSYVIKKGETECFECEAKATPTKFPICTIRNTPDKPVHCVVWAKELFKLFFGERENSYLFEKPVESADTSVYMPIVSAPPAAMDGPAAVQRWARGVFQAVFADDIRKRLEMVDLYKTAKKRPQPVDLDAVETGLLSSPSGPAMPIAEQRVMSLRENADLFLSSLSAYYSDAEARKAFGSIEFSKDEARDLDFVTAATNIRAWTFGMECQSRFTIKSIAGNIIAAIATTNAIVAGMEVLEAIKIVRGDDVMTSCRYTWVQRTPSANGHILMPCRLSKPSPTCLACGMAKYYLYIDTRTTSIRDFFDKVLHGELSIVRPEINNYKGFDLADTRLDDEDDEEWQFKQQRLDMNMTEKLGDGTTLTVSDVLLNSLSFDITVEHRDGPDIDPKKYPQGFALLTTAVPSVAAPPTQVADAPKADLAVPQAVVPAVPAAAAAAVAPLSSMKRTREEAGLTDE